jgi:gliding motility-associated-like protein
MKNNILLLSVIAFTAMTQVSRAQLQASNWYFGFNAGINFDPTTGAVTPITNGQIRTNEGCATISDENGTLLFYTDGSFVYDRSHAIMQNGQGLRGNPSSTQSAIIIPKPQDPNIYYIFTVDTGVGGGAGGADRGLNLYEVDMTRNSGFGAVTTNIASPRNLIFRCSEKITAINHSVNDEILVTALANDQGVSNNYNSFWTFTVGATGINTVPRISVFGSVQNDRRGNLKISPDGLYIASCNMSSGTFLYDYDQSTGAVTNQRQIAFSGPNTNGYGVEFSPDSSLMYVTASNDNNAGNNDPAAHQSTLYQINLSTVTGPFILNMNIIDTRQGYRGSLQLGIDGRIYRALADSFTQGRPFLGVINNPNTLGAGCNYTHDAIPLAGRLSTQGLPPFIQSYFALLDVENTCLGDATSFSFQTDTTPTTISWDFGDGTTSTLENPTHVYAQPGIYNVVLVLDYNGSVRTYRKNVQIFATPVVNPVTNIEACDTDFDGREQFDLITRVNPQILGSQDAAVFNIAYFNSMQEAMDNANPITGTYFQNTGVQTIYARIANRNNAACAELANFTISVYEQPVAAAVGDLAQCDDNFDGIETFDLAAQTSTVLGAQNAATFTITYHVSPSDANSGLNSLPVAYRNTAAFRQTIYVRMVNNAGITCVDTATSFDLIVHPKPVATSTSAFQCDEDGTLDSRTIFNLSEFDTTVASNASGVTVSYHINLNDATNNTAPLDNQNYRNTTPSQIIFARVTDDTTGCFSTSQVTLSVSASDAQDTSLALCDNDGTSDGFITFDLNQASASVLAIAPANVTVNYYASTTDALTEQNALPLTYTNTTANNQVIYARAESPDGNCFGISEVTLIVNPLPIVEPRAIVDYCGNDPQPLVIDAGALTGNTGSFTYLWSTGETTYSIQTAIAGDYIVDVTNSNGCVSRRTVTVIISEPAAITGIAVINAGAGPSGSATINITGNSNYQFRISRDDAFQDSNVFNNLAPGFYTAFVKDRNGCGTTRLDFSVVGYPRFFTPNNDGFNDFWQLLGVSVVFEPRTDIFIFDRFGKLLKQLSPEGPGWDGTFNGAPLPSNDYWFQATLLDGTTFSANFSLKR